MVSRYKINSLVCLLLLLFPILASAKIDVILDRTTVEVGESFTVEFESDGDVSGDPNFSVLEKQFRIISRSESRNIQFINGNLSSQKKWTLILMPRKSGILTIPSVKFGKDKSPARKVTVKKAGTTTSNKGDELIFVEAAAEPRNAYIQSQIIYTVRIYHAINLVNASLSELKLSDSNAIVEKLGKDISYEKRINGRRYKVFEKRYAIFPQKSGKLTVDPVEFEGQYVNRRRVLQAKFMKTKPIKLTVKPQPVYQSTNPGDSWLPANKVTVEEAWSDDPTNFKVGEPITRTVVVSAPGLDSRSRVPPSRVTRSSIPRIPRQPGSVAARRAASRDCRLPPPR